MLLRITSLLALTLAILSGYASTTSADTDVDLNDNGLLTITTDESDDYVYLFVDGDQLEIRIFQFDANDRNLNDLFTLVWNSSLDDLEDEADSDHSSDEDLADISQIKIFTYGGNDVVRVEGINQKLTVYTNDDDDAIRVSNSTGLCILKGQSGNDSIFGSLHGFNSIYGGDGDDRLTGGNNADMIDGGEGNDYAHGKSGNDEIIGRKGNDELFGGGGNDEIDGGDGNDEIYGQDGDDELSGGSGDDFLWGGYDRDLDQMDGGDGADEFHYRTYRIKNVWFDRRTGQWFFPPRQVVTNVEVDNVIDFDHQEGDVKKSKRL
jgi:Ca2+-binding RTX toxin-like protein